MFTPVDLYREHTLHTESFLRISCICFLRSVVTKVVPALALDILRLSSMFRIMFSLMTSAIQCTRQMKDRTFFIHGASGGVGTSIAKILLSLRQTDPQFKNIQIVASCSTERAEQYLTRLGIDLVVNRTDSTYMEKVHAVNGGNGPDVIFEMLANVNLQKDLVRALFRSKP